MNLLFTTSFNFNGIDISYKVSFHDDAYHFTSSDTGSTAFYVKRDGDQWISNGVINEDLFSAATTALEKYLLAQH